MVLEKILVFSTTKTTAVLIKKNLYHLLATILCTLLFASSASKMHISMLRIGPKV